MKGRFLVFALVACRTAPAQQPTPPPPIHHEVPDDHSSLAARAEQALAADTPLDYDRPFTAKPDPRVKTFALFHQACDAGDTRSCWRGLALGDATFLDAVVSHCRHGDMPSCRTLPRDKEGQPGIDAPGSAGRSWACRYSQLPGCDVAAIRRECEAGFPDSCRTLANARDATAQEMKVFTSRVTKLSREGCALGILGECDEAMSPYELNAWSPEEQLTIARTRCSEMRLCGYYGQMRLDAGDVTGARDAFEVACQYKSSVFGTCMQLGDDYLDGKLPEPMPGRGQRLLDFDCNVVLEAMKSRERVVATRPECKRAKLLGE